MGPAGDAAAPRPPRWLLPALLLASLGLAWGQLTRPFHADEACQWSLAAEADAHSLTGDRFHGPTLGLATRAAYALGGADLAEASAVGLRAIPFAFGLGLVFLPWLLPLRGAPGHLAALLAVPIAAASARFIQEPLMAAALVVAAALWIRSGPAGDARFRLLAGLCAGFALACKVTAALHLAAAAAAILLLRQAAPGWRGFVAFAAAALVSWVLWQSGGLADLSALGTWCDQLGRAFGVATGLAAPPLPMESPVPWWVTAGLLALSGALRLLARRSGKPLGALPGDVVLLAAALAFLVHLALPYKTPWLLLSLDAALAVLVLPSLLPELGTFDRRAPVALALAIVPACPPDRHDYAETAADVPALAAALLAPGEGRPSLVLVKGEPAWPLPFYLRGGRVAYGEIAEPEAAEAWLVRASGAEPPEAPGRRAIPFRARDNELWWALAREPLAGRIESALRPAR